MSAPPIEIVEKQAWKEDFWNCFSPTDLCLITTFLPCFTYGKTHHRLENGGSSQNYSPCNSSCCIWYCSSYCSMMWLPTFMQRGKIRARYGLEGSGLGDFAKACCCPCCDLIQQEKEMAFRESQQTPGSAVTEQYEHAAGMQYGQK